MDGQAAHEVTTGFPPLPAIVTRQEAREMLFISLGIGAIAPMKGRLRPGNGNARNLPTHGS
ncbi:hypothetical protein GCM10027172_26010 [Halomonas garicola]